MFNFLDLANELIPNYDSLPNHVRESFELTQTGNELRKAVDQLHNAKNPGFLTQFFQIPFLPDLSPESDVEAVQADFQNKMRSSQEYQDLIRKIKLVSVLQKKIQTLFKNAYLNRFERITTQLNAISQNHISFLSLAQFNADHAKTLAKKPLSIAQWLVDYEASLQDYIKNNIGLINGKEPFPKPSLISKDGAKNSLANLYTYLCQVRNNHKEVKWCVDSIYKMADAHAIIQATGFATQNETSQLATFDIINYFRMSGSVAEAKTILSKFIRPFIPLFNEYSNINKEQNIARQIVRTVMPMLIVAAVVILVAALLSSVVIPEIAFFFILLPTIYLGLVAASSYVVLKDRIYNNLYQRWHGGQFNTPEYQVNEGMIKSFGNAQTAKKVRDFYVNEIKACATKQAQYQSQTKLSDADKDSRRANADRDLILQFEWYEIHSNPKSTTNDAVNTILNRLQRDGRLACDAVQEELKNEIEEKIPAFVHEIADEIKISVESNAQPQQGELRFFKQPKPSCFERRMEVERLNALKEDITQMSTPISTQTGA